jgi:hypothetical protein
MIPTAHSVNGALAWPDARRAAIAIATIRFANADKQTERIAECRFTLQRSEGTAPSTGNEATTIGR